MATASGLQVVNLSDDSDDDVVVRPPVTRNAGLRRSRRGATDSGTSADVTVLSTRTVTSTRSRSRAGNSCSNPVVISTTPELPSKADDDDVMEISLAEHLSSAKSRSRQSSGLKSRSLSANNQATKGVSRSSQRREKTGSKETSDTATSCSAVAAAAVAAAAAAPAAVAPAVAPIPPIGGPSDRKPTASEAQLNRSGGSAEALGDASFQTPEESRPRNGAVESRDSNESENGLDPCSLRPAMGKDEEGARLACTDSQRIQAESSAVPAAPPQVDAPASDAAASGAAVNGVGGTKACSVPDTAAHVEGISLKPRAMHQKVTGLPLETAQSRGAEVTITHSSACSGTAQGSRPVAPGVGKHAATDAKKFPQPVQDAKRAKHEVEAEARVTPAKSNGKGKQEYLDSDEDDDDLFNYGGFGLAPPSWEGTLGQVVS